MNIPGKKITRREFNTRLAGLGVGLASAGIFPSFLSRSGDPYPPGKFLDVHHHLGGDLVSETGQFTLDPLIRWMDKHDVSQTVILSPIRYPEEFYAYRRDNNPGNDELLERFAESNGRLLPFCIVHPDAFDNEKEIVRILRNCKTKGVIGFGELKPTDKEGNARYMPVDDPAMKRIYAACAEVDLSVLLHIDNRFAIDVPGLPAFEKVLKEFPEVNFIGHANGWWNSISGDAKEFKGYPTEKITPGGAAGRLLAEYPNVYADLSAGSGLNAITRDPDFGKDFLVQHQDKLMFGTDAIGGSGRESHFEFYNKIDLVTEIKTKLFTENARKLLKI